MKGIAILGSTGSIGRSTLEIIRMHPGRFRVVSLAAGNNIALLKRQIEEFKPGYVSVLAEKAALRLKRSLKRPPEIGFGIEGARIAASCPGAGMAVSAISGAAGLLPTLAAIRAGKDIALANKETLVMAGAFVMKEAKRAGVKLLPVDSEHSALFQAMAGQRRVDVRRIILTASGGPFLKTRLNRLKDVTPEQALRHPRWDMGKKVTVDSATLMNKGFEVIEARWLFDMPLDGISVFIHPQSIVHSMVEFVDGSVVAQLGSADMKGPIAYALSWPERIDAGVERLDFKGLKLEFLAPPANRFPCLSLAYSALKAGGACPAALSAADEVAVDAFLRRKLRFTDIYRVLGSVLERASSASGRTLDDIIEADRAARELAEAAVKKAWQRL